MNILEIAGKYGIEVTKQGGVYVAYCCFHDDTGRPNLTFYPETNSYFCYSCNVGGDIIQFVSLIEGISRQEATNKIYERLDFLLDHLNINKKEPCNEVANLQISKLFNQFLKEYPSKLSQVLEIMKDIDVKLAAKDIYLDEATNLIQQTSSHLSSLR